MKKLHLGCGQNYYKGWINLDRNPDNFSDLMHDLEVYPWPFEDNTFDEIWADQLLEHLSDVPKAVREVHRILKPGGVFSGQVPYCGSVWAFIDPTHKAFFSERSFLYYSKDAAYGIQKLSGVTFSIVKTKLVGNTNTPLARLRNLIPFRNLLKWFLWNMYDGVKFYLVK